MQSGFLLFVLVVNLLCSLTIDAHEIDSDTYLLDWLKNSEHYAREKVVLEEYSDAIISIFTPSAKAAQNIVAVLNTVRKQDAKWVQQETINAIEAANLIASKDGSTQRTALAKLCQHAPPTLLGKISIADMLVHSSANLEQIRSRQEVIKALCDDDALRTKLANLRDAYAKNLDSMHMFQNKLLLTSLVVLSRFIKHGLIKNMSLLSLGASMQAYLQELALAGMLLEAARDAYDAKCNKLKTMARGLIIPFIVEAAARFVAGDPGSCVYDVYKKYTQPNKDLISCLDFCSYNRHIVNFCLNLRDLAQQHDEIKKIKSLSCLDDFEQKMKTDSGLKLFFDLLKKEPHALWQSEQAKLIGLTHIYQHELAGLYAIAGETEAYLAVAQTKKHFDGHEGVKMAFTEFINGGDVKLEMKNVWNPSLDDEKAVPNSLIFSDAAKNHKILTGSNMGGKSTLIKAIIANLLLSQTFGVAFAQEMKHQPIDQLLVSLNITDNTGKASLFEAEVNRAAHILATLRNDPSKNSFVACDELFVGTSSTEAGIAAKTVALEIAKANAASIFATHHGKVVTNLAGAAQTQFANIKMDAVQDEQGHTVYTYRCKEGISEENIARKLFEERIGVPMATE